MPLLARPECLHTPALYEGRESRISWGDVPGAEGYILERSFDETFMDAMLGKLWEYYDDEDKSWSAIESDGMTWEAYMTQTSIGIGLTWEAATYGEPSWAALNTKNLDWNNWAAQPASFEIFRGLGSLEEGNAWSDLDAQLLSWLAIEALGQSWDVFQHYVGHRGTNDTVPYGARMAMYQVAAYDDMGVASDFFTSGSIPVLPLFTRDSILQWSATAGERYRILMNIRNLRDTEMVPLTLRYHGGVLDMEGFIKCDELSISSNEPGEMRFRCTKAVQGGVRWSGCVGIVQFTAKRTGLAEARLF